MTVLVKLVYECLAKNSTTTLISKNIAHRRYITNYLLAIIQARISTSTENAGYALLISKQSLRSTKHITSHYDIPYRRKYL